MQTEELFIPDTDCRSGHAWLILAIAVFFQGAFGALCHLHATPSPSLIFSENMVLQRDRALPVWGTADSGKTVTVSVAGKSAFARVDASGNWKVTLPALALGGPVEMRIDDGAGVVIFKNVLVGDVWFCAGQSNMAFSLKDSFDADLEIAAADRPQIRCFSIAAKASLEPLKAFDPAEQKTGWQIAAPKTAGGFSAVAWYFAKEVQAQTGVPVGIVTAAWGGTPIGSWTPGERLRDAAFARGWFDSLNKVAAKIHANPKLFVNGPEVMLQNQVGSDYNGMVHPAAPLALRGFLWYQGEQNAGSGKGEYTETLRRLISGWHDDFQNPDLPFYFVQLPNFTDRYEGSWPNTREAQLYALRIPNTGMATTIDLGESFDIHPHSKQEVGRRLARLALAKVYGKTVEYSGPIYASTSVDGAGIRLSFAHRGGGLWVRDGGELREFQIAGADRKFVPAQAVIDKETKSTVFVWSNDVPAPRAVRYAWRNNPSVNLYNKEGLPASPFRTDDWPAAERSDWAIPETLQDVSASAPRPSK